MPYFPLPRFLFRAPLLSLRALTDRTETGQRLLDHPLGAAALALASPDLAAGLARGSRAKTALGRYQRRAAFRPTPHGLLAGVGIGALASRSVVRTETPTAVLRVAWSRLADLARALLDVREVRDQTRIRRAPSILLGRHTVLWLGPGADDAMVEERRADLDDPLAAILEATAAWTPWPSVRGLISADEDQADDLLATMIEDGVLHVDLVPPLVGRDPGDWMQARLSTISVAGPVTEQLTAVRDATRVGDMATAQAMLAALPGSEGPASGLDATLVFSPARAPTLSRAAIGRAAVLAPLLFRLQEALASPVAERVPQPSLANALDATTEIFGAGAIDLAAFALGEYGVNPAGDDAEDEDDQPGGDRAGDHRRLITLLVDRVADAARHRRAEVALRSHDLEPLLPPIATPPTCELFVTPRRARARANKPPGDGWLLGLHAPAGSSWGRFAFALGDSATTLLEPLREAERAARPAEQAVDVVFSPRQALGDICAHPPLRQAALALTGWPDDDQAALTVADLELCADPAALEPLALRTSGGIPVSPSPLHRVRSTTAPPGIWRLLTGWSLCRQHAPWAMTPGPLGDLDWTPRFSIDGFVVAPASWRIPADISTRGASARAVRAWRLRARLPRFVQVGVQDELLPVDLTSPGAAADLVGHARVHEIWPPLGDTPDESGRRIEAIVALVEQPDADPDADPDPDPDERARIDAAIAATAQAGRVPPPGRAAGTAADSAWRTFRLFGVASAQDAVLGAVVGPAVRDARDAGEITGWFFLRYVDPPGRRPHLRLRVRLASQEAPFARRLERLVDAALRAGDVVTVETAPYFPEAARFGGPEVLPAVHALFQADSDLACALLTLEEPRNEPSDGAGDLPDLPELADPRLPFLVAAYDTLAAALGLDAAQRRALARRRRDAHASEVSPEMSQSQSAWFRDLRRGLRTLLTGPRPAWVAAAFKDYRAAARQAVVGLDTATRNRILPPLLHLSAVRLMGLDRLAEIHAYTFWERTLESLDRHPQS